MKKLLFWFLTLYAGIAVAQEPKKLQKFNPVYSNQEEINELLSFVTANIRVELTENQVQGVNGQMVCRFRIDTTGRIYDISVTRKLEPWIDMAIMGAMVRLPFYGVASIGRDGRKQDVERQLVFSFGKPYFDGMDHVGFNGDAVKRNIARSVDGQQSALFKERREARAAWDGFTQHNSKLRYDGRDALRGSYPVLPDGGAEGLDPLEVYTPTISVVGGVKVE